MYRILPCLLVLSLGAGSAAFAQTVRPENVRVAVEGEQILVHYDLAGPAGKKSIVRMRASLDGGRTWSVVPHALEGDVGKGVRTGRDRRAVWDVLRDYPQGLEAPGFVVEVEALPQKRSSLLYLLGGGVAAGLGTAAVVMLTGQKEGPPADGATLPGPPARPGSN